MSLLRELEKVLGQKLVETAPGSNFMLDDGRKRKAGCADETLAGAHQSETGAPSRGTPPAGGLLTCTHRLTGPAWESFLQEAVACDAVQL